jgi:aryl-alcohol dehydrogenase-like predicted oxidoreductase
METLRIGSLTAGRVGLGCNNFGMRIDEDAAAEVVRAALDAGIDFFDTADVYGGTRSEEFLGRALAAAGRRDDVVVATKFGSSLGEGRGGAGASWVAQACEDSLRRLGTDRIDLYQLHQPDPAVPIEETLGALDELVRAGKVREIGNSNFTAAQIDEAAETSAARGWSRFVTAQNHYSLLERGPQAEVVPACERQGLLMLPYFPLASGLLTGKYRRDQAPPPGTRLSLMPAARADRVLTARNFDLVESLAAWASEQGHTILDLAVAWLAAQPAMGPIIAGATSAAQVRANAAAARWDLTDDALDEVDAILAST